MGKSTCWALRVIPGRVKHLRLLFPMQTGLHVEISMIQCQLGVQDIPIIAPWYSKLLLGFTWKSFHVFFPSGRFCNAVTAQLSLPDPVCSQAAPKAQTRGFTFPLITEHDSCGFLSLTS